MSEVVENLRQPGPWAWKLKSIARNYWIRIVKRQSCCGHDGEPGC